MLLPSCMLAAVRARAESLCDRCIALADPLAMNSSGILAGQMVGLPHVAAVNTTSKGTAAEELK